MISSSWIADNRFPIILAIAFVFVYGYFVWNITGNPPGFYVDEACIAYNAHTIATTGAGEAGVSFPLYFQCFTQGYTQWVNPTPIYLLGSLYLFITPSNVSARVFTATIVFVAALLLGFLSYRLSKRRAIGVIVALTAIFTPWLFEVSRLVLDPYTYPICVIGFLFFIYRASQRSNGWNLADCVLIALSLMLITYSYTIGRFLGPVLGFGLIIFATNRLLLLSVIKTWIVYSLTMIPFLVVYFTNTGLMNRFRVASALSPEKGFFENLGAFLSGYLSDIGPTFLLFVGDVYQRHHVTGMGALLVGTVALSILGIVLTVAKYRGSPWWRYVFFGLIVSVVPGALTNERSHTLRLIAFPIFLMVFLVPALSWLFGDERLPEFGLEKPESDAPKASTPPRELLVRRALLISLLVITAFQAVVFQVQFRTLGENRGAFFNDAYPRILDRAIKEESRPIYLDDGSEPIYILGLWYGATRGLDRGNFHHLLDNEFPPEGALVIGEGNCSDCEVVAKEGNYTLFRNRKAPPVTQATAATPKAEGGDLSTPRGIAFDSKLNYYITDSGNNRIQKFAPDGKLLLTIGATGSDAEIAKQPNGIAVDQAGNIFVTDADTGRLIKYGPDGKFVKDWKGPDNGFYGPRDIGFAPNKTLLIVDQGRLRIVVFDPATETFTTWGTAGDGDGQFKEASGLGISKDKIFVMDNGNSRIQVFDLNGNFIRQWPVPEFQKYPWHYPDAVFDEQAKLLYVTLGIKSEILVFDEMGNAVPSTLKLDETAKLANPSSILINETKGKRTLVVLNSASGQLSEFVLDTKK